MEGGRCKFDLEIFKNMVNFKYVFVVELGCWWE